MAYKIQRTSFNTSGGINGVDYIDCGTIPVYKKTLAVSQTIAADEAAQVFGPITIPSGLTLTINGTIYIDNRGYISF